MADQGQETEQETVKSVSSLRSRFEGLASLSPATTGDNTTPTTNFNSPRFSKFLETSNQPSTNYGRGSLDIPRSQSPWRNQINEEPTKRVPPQTPPAIKNGSPRFGHSRPLSMNVPSSPSFAPAVLVESPKSPPRGHLFNRSGSKSPERRGFLNFGSSGTSVSYPGTRTSSRPNSPKIEDGRPNIIRNKSDDSQGKGGVGKGPPPPVNRADKPKIPAKPSISLIGSDNTSKRMSIAAPASAAAAPEPKISPFSTPPSSEGSPSPERNAFTTFESIEPRLAALAGSRQMAAESLNEDKISQKPMLPKDPRLLGFSSRITDTKFTEEPEKRDARTLSLSSAANGGKIASSIPAQSRSNTLPIRDPRTLGFSSGPPAPPPPRRSQDLQRPIITSQGSIRDARPLGLSSEPAAPARQSMDVQRPLIPSLSKKVETPTRPYRDPRSMGFSSSSASSVPSAPPEPSRPKSMVFPKRLESLPPARPSEASKKPPTYGTIPPTKPQRPVSSVIPRASAPIVSAASQFPPPPKRNTLILEPSNRTVNEIKAPIRKDTGSTINADDSDEAEENIIETSAPRTDYPDTTQANRRPPRLATGVPEIYIKHDARIFDVSGRNVCISGFSTRVWDLMTGENLMTLSHGETVKVLSVIFKPASRLEDEGKRIWIGNNIGELHEIDIETQTTVATNGAHNRREITKLFRHKTDVWSLDDEGKLFVWPADESGSPNMKYSHHSHKVQRGYTFGIVVRDQLWHATGKDLHVYRPGKDSDFQVLQKPLTQSGAGEITSGTFPGANSNKVLFGYTDGKVVIYNTKDYSCIATVKASDYKINSMTMVGNLLWAAYKTGKIYVYDTSVTPWKVKKDWRAHDGPVNSMIFDPSAIWTLTHLQITSLGQDNCIRSWDATLEDDWIESEMQLRDVEYCRFREVRASILTWNVGASNPYDIPGEFLRDAIHVEDPPEILVFGFQELVDLEDRAVTAKNILGLHKKKEKKDTAKAEHISRVYREWRDYLGKAINRHMDPEFSYTELHTSSLIGLFLCVFVRQEEKRNIKSVSSSEVKCGMKGHYGNKGALILRFVYDDSSVCFVNCHLAAGQTHTSHRNNDIASILEAEALPAETRLDVRTSTYVGGGDGTQILDHEICVVNGDLNYRIDAMPRNTVVDLIRRNELAKLLERDQLMLSRRRVSGFRLSPFVEAPITFAPTYKYDVGTDNYDSSEKKRSPAWCDRILYRGPGRIKQTEYRRHEVRISDHRPVSGSFKMRIKTIDKVKREAVFDACVSAFLEEKRKMAAEASIDYLVLGLGVDVKEAQKLISEAS